MRMKASNTFFMGKQIRLIDDKNNQNTEKRINYFDFLNKGTLEQASPNISELTTGISFWVISAYAESGICLLEHPLMMTGTPIKFFIGIEETTS